MPTAPSPNMGLVLPTLNSDVGVWDDYLNPAIGSVIDAHDHTPGKGVLIPTAALNINADLTFAGKSALNLGSAQFTPVAAAFLAGKNRSFWVNSVDNELYFRNNAGTDIKFTTGGTLNISLLGGIGGDYSASGALFSFDDATDRYLAQQQGAPRPWAGMAVGNLDIYEQAASIANRVRLQSPAGLAASYALTFPAALPGSTLLMQMSAAGAITTSNTIANAVILSSTLNVAGVATFPGNIGGTPTFTGAVTLNTTLAVGTNATIGGTLGVTGPTTLLSTVAATGLITANAGVTAAVDQNLNVSGTGKLNHGDYLLGVEPAMGQFSGGGGTGAVAVSSGVGAGMITYTLSTSGGGAVFPIPELLPGYRIKTIRVAHTTTGGPPTVSLRYTSYTTVTLGNAITPGATVNNGTVDIKDYAVDVPTAMGIYAPGGGLGNFARRASISIVAVANTTVIYGISVIYDYVAVPSGA